jgi:protein-tyrosine phosphatase
MTEAPFRILVVCTGNVCRSPVAAAVLRDALEEIAPGAFSVESAGTRALAGEAAQPLSASIATRLGSGLDGFVARQLTEPMVASADLVLTLASGHIRDVLRFSPAALKRTFTLREFARILATLPLDPAEHAASTAGEPRRAWKRLVDRAWAAKASTASVQGADDDVIDPYRRSAEVYEQMADELIPALEAVFGRAERVARG